MDKYLHYQEGLIKSLLLSPESLTEVSQDLLIEDIEDDRYQAVYKVMLQLNL
jgi:replicative DNA helicase